MAVAELLDVAPLPGSSSNDYHRWPGTILRYFRRLPCGHAQYCTTKSFGLTQTMLPVVLGSSFLGMFFGAVFMGVIADRIGRRPAFLSISASIRFLRWLEASAPMPWPNRYALFCWDWYWRSAALSDAYLSEVFLHEFVES